jgi:hypothetical protein
MMNSNLDRFSSPLETERVNPYHMQQFINEQNQLNKKDLIDSYIHRFYDFHGYTPGAEEIQEHFYRLDMDLDLIEQRLEVF